MLKELTADEINRRRKQFALVPFCAGVIILGIVTVPLASIYLRTWKPVLYWLPAFILISVLPFEMGGLFFASILINAGYSYIAVKAINNSVLSEQSGLSMQTSMSSDSDIERTLLDILEEHSSLSIGRICAYSDYPHEQVKAKLDYLKKAGVVFEKTYQSGTVVYSLL